MNWFKLKTEKTLEMQVSWIEREREKAIQETIKRFQEQQEKFLWSADLKFEKRSVCYKLIERMQNIPSVLVLATKESALFSWWKDFAKSSSIKERRIFVSENPALVKYNTVYTREEYGNYIVNAKEDGEKEMFAVDSVKGILDSIYFGGKKDKLKWLTNMQFDLVIVDQEQSMTTPAQIYQILHKIQRKHTLYLRSVSINRIQQEGFTEEQLFFFPPVSQKKLKGVEIQMEALLKKDDSKKSELKKDSFLCKRSKEEREYIKEIEQFLKEKIDDLEINDKGTRYAFTDRNKVIDEVAYAWMWLTEREGKLFFKYKFNQNEKNSEIYKNNQIIVNEIHLQTIKNIIQLLTER